MLLMSSLPGEIVRSPSSLLPLSPSPPLPLSPSPPLPCPFRWSSLKSLAAKKREILSDALEKANCFHENRKQQASWLSGAERRAYAKWKPCGLPETAEADITKHQVRHDYMYTPYKLPTYITSEVGCVVELWLPS